LLIIVRSSKGHLLDKFALNGAVSLILSVEVLALVTHSVASVSGDWNLDSILRHWLSSYSYSVLGRLNCSSLKAISKLLESFMVVKVCLL
jgi:hypothetical protein